MLRKKPRLLSASEAVESLREILVTPALQQTRQLFEQSLKGGFDTESFLDDMARAIESGTGDTLPAILDNLKGLRVHIFAMAQFCIGYAFVASNVNRRDTYLTADKPRTENQAWCFNRAGALAAFLEERLAHQLKP